MAISGVLSLRPVTRAVLFLHGATHHLQRCHGMNVRHLTTVLLLAILSGAQAGEELRLANGTTVQLVVNSRGDFVGLGAIAIDGAPVCAPAPPMRPAVETVAGERYTRMRVDSIDRGARCAVVLKLSQDAGAQEDELRLVIRPDEVAISGKWYVGFSYQYVFRSEHSQVGRIVDLTHWELGGRSDRLYMVPPHRLTSSEPLQVRREVEFLRTPSFYFQGNELGTLLLAYEFDEAAPLIHTRMEKPAGKGATAFSDEVHMVPGGDVHTPWRSVLLCRQDDLQGLAFEDEYTRCYEYMVAKLRAQFGIPPAGTRWLCVRGSEGLVPGGTTETYRDLLPMLQEAKSLGFERLWPGCIWEDTGGGQSPPGLDQPTAGLDLSPYGGGEEGLRALCDAAEVLDMKVYAPAPTGQLPAGSPFWQSNPEWFVKRRDGNRTSHGAGRLTWTDLTGGYYDYSLTAFEKARDVGIAGLWLDSFAAVASAVNYADPLHPRFNLIPAFRRMKDLAEMGYEDVLIEGAGPAGVNAAALGDLPPEAHTLYKGGHFVHNVGPGDTNDYFRMVANYCTPIVALHYTLPTYRGRALSDHPEQMTRVAYANEAFRRTRDFMVKRTLLHNDDDVWTCVGVRWDTADDKTRVYWPYVDMRVQLGPRERACEVLSGKEVEMASAGALLRGEHVYTVERVVEPQPEPR